MLLRRITQHVKDQNWTALDKRCSSQCVVMGAVLMCAACTTLGTSKNVDVPYITSSSPLRIVSANDGNAVSGPWNSRSSLPDSLTVIDLSPDAPPVTRTVSGTVPNTFSGDPKSAIIGGGRYAFIPDHNWGADGDAISQLSVVDLESPTLNVIETIPLPPFAWQVMAHPDGARVFVIGGNQFFIYRMDGGQPVRVAESKPFHLNYLSFDIDAQGTSIIVTAAEELAFEAEMELHLFTIEGDRVTHKTKVGINPNVGEIDQPFAPRFSPDGSRVLVPNGLGLAIKPPLDAILSIDMTATPPVVTDMIPNVAQGLESLAFHPSGRFAVVTCIDGPYIGHLAVIDLAAPSMQLLYYLPIEFVPQGIEFSPDGSMLFVQATTANHINVYDIDGLKLIKRPYVLRTGEGPASMALTLRGQN